jgi:ATP-dependent RNA helicase RhlE
MGHNAVEIHGNRTLAQRKAALSGFKNGTYRVLVATDIAARGIDVTGIALVINFDLPEVADDYVHRIGRTGRAERQGKAISFAQPDQGHMVSDIERVTRKQIPMQRPPSQLPQVSLPAHAPERDFGGRGGYGRRDDRGSRGGYGGRRDDRGSRGGYGNAPRRDDRGPRRDDRRDSGSSSQGSARPAPHGAPSHGGSNAPRHGSSGAPRRDDRRGGKSNRPPRVKRPKQGGKLEDYHFGSFKVKD